MQKGITKTVTRNSFLLSIIVHLLLLLFLLMISSVITLNSVEKTKKPAEFYHVPAYVYQGSITPATSHPSIQHMQPKLSKPISQPSLSKPITQPKKTHFSKNAILHESSILDMSRSMIQQNQVNQAINRLNDTEPPILLIGDKHAIVDPLIKLIGRSLSAHFHYPNIEGIFGARGRVYIELVVHPEGYFSDVQIVQPSEIQDFNTAALYAVNMAPTVVGVNKFLPTAKRFIVGFVFE